VLLHSSSVMLALKQGLSLSSTKILGAWSPEQEASLVAWYQYQTGINLNGSDVSEWADYTGVIIIWFRQQKLNNLLIQVEL
jgi:hypothetical protein